MNGIKYISWNDTSGYAKAAHGYLQALLKTDIPLTWTPMVVGDEWGKELFYAPHLGQALPHWPHQALCNREIDYDTVIIHLVPEYFPRWIQQEPGKKIIGYTTWETSELPKHWAAILNQLDRLWVPCEWNRDVFQRGGVTVPIDVIPHILPSAQPKVVTPPPAQLSEIPKDHYVFYSVGVWSKRKANHLLLEAYWKAFSANDPVTLVLKTSQADSTNAKSYGPRPLRFLASVKRRYKKLSKAFPNRPNTLLIAEENTPELTMEAIHQRGDCYVALPHAEGWGLGAFEAVNKERPVIMTSYGGQLDFLPEEHAYRVAYELIAVDDPANAQAYAKTQQWAKPDVKHASSLMKNVFANQDAAKEKGRALKEHAQTHFSEKTVLQKMLAALAED